MTAGKKTIARQFMHLNLQSLFALFDEIRENDIMKMPVYNFNRSVR